jgi:hypothetical protein
MNENGKLLSVGSQSKNGSVIILVSVDDFCVGQGFLIDSNVKIAFLRVEATAGTSAHITSGGNFSYQTYLYVVFGLYFSHVLFSGFTYLLPRYRFLESLS